MYNPWYLLCTFLEPYDFVLTSEYIDLVYILVLLRSALSRIISITRVYCWHVSAELGSSGSPDGCVFLYEFFYDSLV